MYLQLTMIEIKIILMLIILSKWNRLATKNNVICQIMLFNILKQLRYMLK